jgi:hypothetical protein
LTAIGYPRPAPLFTASDPVFFEDITFQSAKVFRSFIKSLHFSIFLRDVTAAGEWRAIC